MDEKFPEEGELLLCTVTRIMGTTVFVNIENYNKEGVIATSEIAPGRIRNIRDYVTINKKIVCKVLRVNKEKGNIDLSLRRVSQKEAHKVLEEYKKEKDSFLILKIVLKEKALQIAEKIKRKYSSLNKFLEKVRENNSLINEFVSQEEAEKILDLLKEKMKEKVYSQKAIISISSNASNGISIIKDALLSAKNVKISYIGAPYYSIVAESNDPKDAEKKLKSAIEIITGKIKMMGGKIEVKKE
ncbi:MAG: S1 RNA-binding domain-containing protein [Candidatus Pacearchaeota archaeon]